MALTEQKRRYAEARLSGMPKKQAAISAGCPERTASQAASRLEKDREVQAAMGRIKVLESQNPAVTPEAPTGEPDAYIPAPAPDAVTFFFQVMNDLRADPKLRLDAAKSHAMYTVAKPGEMGKKEQRKEDAQRSGAGKFATAAPPPRLVVDNTR